MSKYTVDMDDFDESRADSAYTGEEPRRGVYPGKLSRVKDHTAKSSGDEGLEWAFEITTGEFKGWWGFLYSNLDSTKWKTQQICYAITGSKRPVTIDTDENGAKMIKKAKPVLMRVITEMNEGERRAKLKTVLPANDDSSDGDEEEKDPFA